MSHTLDVFCLRVRDYNNIYCVSMLSDSHNPERNNFHTLAYMNIACYELDEH